MVWLGVRAMLVPRIRDGVVWVLDDDERRWRIGSVMRLAQPGCARRVEAAARTPVVFFPPRLDGRRRWSASSTNFNKIEASINALKERLGAIHL